MRRTTPYCSKNAVCVLPPAPRPGRPPCTSASERRGGERVSGTRPGPTCGSDAQTNTLTPCNVHSEDRRPRDTKTTPDSAAGTCSPRATFTQSIVCAAQCRHRRRPPPRPPRPRRRRLTPRRHRHREESWALHFLAVLQGHMVEYRIALAAAFGAASAASVASAGVSAAWALPPERALRPPTTPWPLCSR